MMRGHRGVALFFVVLAVMSCSREGAQTNAPDTAGASAVSTLTEDQRVRLAALADGWPQEPSYTVSFNALDPDTALAGEARPSLFDPGDPHWGLPDDENRVLVESYCAACHSLQLVMQHRLDEAGWDAALTRMVAARGMPALRDDVRQRLIAYLSRHFGPAENP